MYRIAPSVIMDTIGKIAASVAARPDKQETKAKTEAGNQGGWGIDLRLETVQR